MRSFSLSTLSLSVLLSMAAGTAFAQTGVGLGTLTPDASAALDIASSSKGVLFPRVALTGVSDAATVPTPAASLIVYNTAATVNGTPQLVINTGTATAPTWAPFGANNWGLSGNKGTKASTSFLGTLDSVAVTIRSNNLPVAQFQPSGALWLGNATSQNTSVGYQAGNGLHDVPFWGFMQPGGMGTINLGYQAGYNSNGSANLHLGYQAGYQNAGSNNQLVGYQAGYGANATAGGSNNQFDGYQAGFKLAGGSNNQFLGYQAGYSNAGGNQNQYIGYQAGYSSPGYSQYFQQMPTNQFIGYQAGYSTNLGNRNSFVGYQAGYNNVGGGANTYLGYQAGYRGQSTEGNVCIGLLAGYNNTTGQNNTFIGNQAGFSSTGTGNIALGILATTGTYSGSVAIGTNAQVTADNVMALGGTGANALKVGIGVTSPSEVLQVQGNILASGTITQNSDRRLKTNVQPLTHALVKVNRLRGVTYEFLPGKGPEGEQIGVIAQEIEQVYPELVRTDATTGIKSVNYVQLTPILLEAIKSLSAQIESTTARTLTLEQAQFTSTSGIEQLRQHLQRLEAQVSASAALTR